MAADNTSKSDLIKALAMNNSSLLAVAKITNKLLDGSDSGTEHKELNPAVKVTTEDPVDALNITTYQIISNLNIINRNIEKANSQVVATFTEKIEKTNKSMAGIERRMTAVESFAKASEKTIQDINARLLKVEVKIKDLESDDSKGSDDQDDLFAELNKPASASPSKPLSSPSAVAHSNSGQHHNHSPSVLSSPAPASSGKVGGGVVAGVNRRVGKYKPFQKFQNLINKPAAVEAAKGLGLASSKLAGIAAVGLAATYGTGALISKLSGGGALWNPNDYAPPEDNNIDARDSFSRMGTSSHVSPSGSAPTTPNAPKPYNNPYEDQGYTDPMTGLSVGGSASSQPSVVAPRSQQQSVPQGYSSQGSSHGAQSGSQGAAGPSSGGGGSQFLQSQRQKYIDELNKNPALARKLADLVRHEDQAGGPAVVESLFNRLAFMESQGKGTTLENYLNRQGNKQFYGPIRNGEITGNLNEKQFNSIWKKNIEPAFTSNILKGATDQGSGNDPNVQHQGGRIKVPGSNEVYNDWGALGHDKARKWREDQQKQYNNAEASSGEKERFGFTTNKPYSKEEIDAQLAGRDPRKLTLGLNPDWGTKSGSNTETDEFNKSLAMMREKGIKLHMYDQGPGDPNFKYASGDEKSLMYDKDGKKIDPQARLIDRLRRTGASSFEYDNADIQGQLDILREVKKAGLSSQLVPKNLTPSQRAELIAKAKEFGGEDMISKSSIYEYTSKEMREQYDKDKGDKSGYKLTENTNKYQSDASDVPDGERRLAHSRPKEDPNTRIASFSKYDMGTTRLYDAPGKRGAMDQLNPQLRDILSEATKTLPDGYRAIVHSADRQTNNSNHSHGRAMDLAILDPSGKPIFKDDYKGDSPTGRAYGNYQNPSAFKDYERLAQAAKEYQEAKYSKTPFRWGGYFGGNYGKMDLMHFDVTGGPEGSQGSFAKGRTGFKEYGNFASNPGMKDKNYVSPWKDLEQSSAPAAVDGPALRAPEQSPARDPKNIPLAERSFMSPKYRDEIDRHSDVTPVEITQKPYVNPYEDQGFTDPMTGFSMGTPPKAEPDATPTPAKIEATEGFTKDAELVPSHPDTGFDNKTDPSQTPKEEDKNAGENQKVAVNNATEEATAKEKTRKPTGTNNDHNEGSTVHSNGHGAGQKSKDGPAFCNI